MSTTDYYTCKWGRITILMGDNYQQFAQTCKAALIASSAWPIVNNANPRSNTAEWADLNTRASMIIFNSVSSIIQNSLAPEVDSQDTIAIWNKLKAYNRSQDRVFSGTLKSRFYTEIFSSETESIRAFILRLESIQAQLNSTPFALSDRDLIDRILHALPDTER